MSFRADDVTRFVENYAAYYGIEYKSKPLSSGDILITLGNATGRLDNRSSKIRPDLIENFLKSLFGPKKEWNEAVSTFFKDGSYKFRTEFQTADLIRFIDDYAAYNAINHTIQPNNKGGSVITLGEASAELDNRKLKIKHTDVDAFLTSLFGKKKKWPTEVETFFADGSYKFKGERPVKPAPVVAEAPIANAAIEPAPDAQEPAPEVKRVYPQRAPVQPPVNTSAPSGLAAAWQRWDTEHPYQYVPIAPEIVAPTLHISAVDENEGPYSDHSIQSRRSHFSPSDIITFIEGYASRLGSNYASAPHDKGGVALTLGIHTARIDTQKVVLSRNDVKDILKVFFGKISVWPDDVATFYEQGFHVAATDEAAIAAEAETAPSTTEPAPEPAAKPIEVSAPINRAKSFAVDTAPANGIAFNQLGVVGFIQNYAAHYGYDYTSQPHNKGGVIVKLAARSARVYDKKSKISQSDLEEIFIELFGKKKVWPAEVRDYFEQGSYTFHAATPNEPANTSNVASSATDTPPAAPVTIKPTIDKTTLLSSASALLGGERQTGNLTEFLAAATAHARKPTLISQPERVAKPARDEQPKPKVEPPPADIVITVEYAPSEPAVAAAAAPAEPAIEVIEEPIAPITVPRPDLQIISATFDVAPPARSVHVMHHLLHHGLVKADDTVRTAAEKVAALMNKHPAVLAKNGAFDISGDEVFKYLDRPSYAFSSAAWTTPLTAYRIWQAAHYFNVNLERNPPTLNAFWSSAENPQPATDNPVYAIAREVYVQHVLPVLDRDANRHIQTLEQLNEAAGFTDAGFRNFMSYAWTAWRSEGGFGKNTTLDDVKNATDIVPSDYLAALEKVLGCRGEELFPFNAWHRILGDEPSAMLSRGAPLSGKKFSIDDLSDASKAILKRISDAGFADLDDVVQMLNHRLEDVTHLPDDKDFTVSIETIGRAISRRQPYPKGFTDLVCMRITEVVNERRAERGLTEPLTAETLFGVKRNPKRTFQHDAEDILMTVLQQPQNKHLLTIYRVAWAYGGKLDDLTAFYDNLSKAYIPNEETGPQPSDELKRLSSALGVEPAALVPQSIWERAQLQQTQTEAYQFTTADGRVVDSEIEAPTNFIARAEARQREVAEAARLRELRVQIIGMLHDRALELATRPDVAIQEAVASDAAAPIDEAPAAIVVQAVAPAVVAPPVIVEEAAPAALADVLADVEADVVIAPVEAAIAPVPPAADTQPLPVEADFRAAALEVVEAFRQLQSANLVMELSLLDRVEGVNRKRKREDLLKVAEALKLELTEAREILEETKTDLAKSGSQKIDRALTHQQVIGALQEYQADIAGRSVLNSYLDTGRDETKDTDIGSNFRPPQSAAQIKSVRERLIASMTQALQQ